MSFPPTKLPPLQDIAPPGGYKPVDFTIQLRSRGPSGLVIWSATSILMAWGFYRLGQSNHDRNEEVVARRKMNYTIAPYLQIEADEIYTLQEKEIIKKEQEIMKHVPNWDANKSVYVSNRWVPRQLHPLDAHFRK